MDSFLLYALAAGLGIALLAGPLGSFVVWRKMAYFGDTLSHACLFGIALGILLQVDLTLAVVVCCLAMAMLLVIMSRNQQVATDTLLGILAHSALSLGLVTLSFMDNVRVDLMAYLFGDLLSVQPVDLLWIYGGGALVLLNLWRIWDPLLSPSFWGELARGGDEYGGPNRGRGGQLEPPPPRRRCLARKPLQRAQPLAHMGQVGAALGGQRKIGAAEQPHAQDLLQLLDAVAHGAGRDTQLFGRLRHAAQAGQGFKRQQALDGRNAPRRAAEEGGRCCRGHLANPWNVCCPWRLRQARHKRRPPRKGRHAA